MTAPKLFMSYSWTSEAHCKWVLDLATQLRESGIDVILDIWELKEGDDKYVFMEKAVTDGEIKKVAIISDRMYALKADGREGGVGTETQIISKELYEKVKQDKFVAIVAEKDEDGDPCLPTYFKSRIYIDLTDVDRFSGEFERLVRWVYDKPLNVKPELGQAPFYVKEEGAVSLGTDVVFRKALEGVRTGGRIAAGTLEEYFELFSRNLERFRIRDNEGEFDDAVVKNIDQFFPYLGQFIELCNMASTYSYSEETAESFRKLFESLLPFTDRTPDVNQWNPWDWDNFRFIVHELFLYAIALFVKTKRFEFANRLLTESYYLPTLGVNSATGSMARFTVFRGGMESLDRRNKRLNLRRFSLRADLIEQRCKKTGVKFEHLMQADFILYIRSVHDILSEVDPTLYAKYWWPYTLLYAERMRGPFEVFVRARSKAYFDRLTPLLGPASRDDLIALLANIINKYKDLQPRWEYHSVDLQYLADPTNIATLR